MESVTAHACNPTTLEAPAENPSDNNSSGHSANNPSDAAPAGNPALRLALLDKKEHGVFVPPTETRDRTGKHSIPTGGKFQAELFAQFVLSWSSIAEYLDHIAIERVASDEERVSDFCVVAEYNRHLSLAVHATEKTGLATIDHLDVDLYSDGRFGTKENPTLRFTYKVSCRGDETTRRDALAATADMTPAKMLGIEDVGKLDSEDARSALGTWHVEIIQYLKMLETGLEIAMMLQAAQNRLYYEFKCKTPFPPAKRFELSLSTFTTASLLCKHFPALKANPIVALATAISQQWYGEALSPVLVIAAIMTAPACVAHALAMNNKILEEAVNMDDEVLVKHLQDKYPVDPEAAVADVDMDATKDAIDALVHSMTGKSFDETCRRVTGTYLTTKEEGGTGRGAKVGMSANRINGRLGKQAKGNSAANACGGHVGFMPKITSLCGPDVRLLAIETMLGEAFEGLLEIGLGGGGRLPGSVISGSLNVRIGYMLRRALPSNYGVAWECPQCSHPLTKGGLVDPPHLLLSTAHDGTTLQVEVHCDGACAGKVTFGISSIFAEAARIVYYSKNPEALPGSRILTNKDKNGGGQMTPEMVVFVESFHAKSLKHVDRTDPVIARALDDMWALARDDDVVQVAWDLLHARPKTPEFNMLEQLFIRMVPRVDYEKVTSLRKGCGVAMGKQFVNGGHLMHCYWCPVCDVIQIPARFVSVYEDSRVFTECDCGGARAFKAKKPRLEKRTGIQVPQDHPMWAAAIILSRDDDKYMRYRSTPEQLETARLFADSLPGTDEYARAAEKLVLYCKKKMVTALNEFERVEIHGPPVRKRKTLSTTPAAIKKREHAAKKRELEGKKAKELKMTKEAIKSREKAARRKARLEALIASKTDVVEK